MPRTPRSAVVRGRARTLQAMVLLTAGSASQRWIPMRLWSGVLGEARTVPSALSLAPQGRGRSAERLAAEREVSYAVRSASNRLPWTSSCLAQVFAAQTMLRRRGAAGVAVIGLRRSGDGWEAHAWLIGSSLTITGGPASDGFTATTLFAIPGGLQPDDICEPAPSPPDGAGRLP